jgi:hypothetical protein
MNLKKDNLSVIIVLGMHRSGTSLVAQLIAKWGINMGNSIYQPNEYNKDGYWEYIPLVSLNEKMFDYLGNKWFFPPKKIDVENLMYHFGEEARKIIAEMDNSHLPWCWKDPRMVFLLPFWKKLLCDHNLIYVISYRNPQSVANSLKERNNMSLTVSLALWEYTSLKILEEVENSNQKIFMEYDSLLDNPHKECERLLNFLNKMLDEQKGDSEFNNMLKVIKPSLSSSTFTSYTLNNDIKALYEFYKEGKSENSETEKNISYDAWEILNYYVDSKNFKGYFAQIYLQTDSTEFSEKRSFVQKYNDGISKIEMDLSQFKNVNLLRFDPLNDWVVVKLIKLELISRDQIIEITTSRSNAFSNQNGLFVFNNPDPQIIFDLSYYKDFQFEKVCIFLDYIAVGDEAKVYFSNNYVGFTNELCEFKDIDKQSILSLENFKSNLIKRFENKEIELGETIDLLGQKTKVISDLNHEIKRLQIDLNKNQLLVEENKIAIEKLIQTVTEKDNLIIEKELAISFQEKMIDKLSRNSIYLENELRRSHSLILSLQNFTSKLTNEISALHKSITYRIIRSITFALIVFNPILLISKLKKWIIIERNCRTIRRSTFYDKEYYLKNNTDVAKSGMNPAKHYLLHGGFEGRNPSKLFDSGFYLKNNLDVDIAHVNPLLHYLLWGKTEDRMIGQVNEEDRNQLGNEIYKV